MILDNSHVFLMNRSKTGKILSISKQSANALGLTRAEAKGRNLVDVFSAEDAARIHAEDLKVLDDNDENRLQKIQFVRGDTGEQMWLAVDRFPCTDHADAEPSIFTIGTDVTREVRAKNEAHAVIAQMELLQDLAHVGYWSFDLETRTLHWSKEVFRIHNATPKDYTPTIETAFRFYHAEDIDFVESTFGRVVKNGGQFDFVKRLEMDDGTSVNVHSQGIAVTNELDQVVKVVGVIKQV